MSRPTRATASSAATSATRRRLRDAMAGCTLAVNFAAETHVDRSLLGAAHFIDTDIKGVLVLLEEARRVGLERFVQISTDEVYGSIESGSFTEASLLNPRNPYSASKAGGDRLAYAYWSTYGVPVIITRASNNYGPYQYPEKLIPLFVTNALRDQPLPLYGDGRNVRDWLHVADHCRADPLPARARHARRGLQRRGRQRAREHRDHPQDPAPRSASRSRSSRPVAGPGRPRSPLLARRVEAPRASGSGPRVDFEQGIAETVRWYVENEWWWKPIKDHDGEFRRYYEQQYGERLR